MHWSETSYVHKDAQKVEFWTISDKVQFASDWEAKAKDKKISHICMRVYKARVKIES